jgi:putative FmdB family regulatory protein
MPVYSYVCSVCGTSFEKELAVNGDNQSVACPNGHREVRKVYSVPNVIFKGTGWYSTDHRKKSTPGSEG